ncbi:hypothetical protein M407DRAFT_244210 [Tulasnella calospora MUT 4182]|uniref:Uncharacterized protein n=1 Tax=Tulasnella calospora MUT 4182 TaxID=1051891 RepID=A0A0C3LUI8_9AGAM|nr:hypothetical protein M407DRAFT_244210 [Tulasnella calospora MUT 4182]
MLPLIVQAATSILLASSLARAQIVEIGQTCNLARNRLTSTTHQFLSDCVPRAYCDPTTSTCKPRQCRGDEFPFKFPPDSPETPLPPFCGDGQFCPDEGDQCLPVVPPGQNCQINRDDECQPAPNAADIQGPWNHKGAICLRFTCFWQNQTVGQPCIVDNTVYTGYRGDGSEFATIISRDNCVAPSLFCDAQDNTCKQALDLGADCTSDKQCISRNCGTDNKCKLPAGTVIKIPLWQYIVTGVGIVAFIAIIFLSLFFMHKGQRAKTQREIREYFHEQTTYRSSIIALHTAARDRTSIYSASESRFSQYDEHGQMIYRDDDSQRQLLDNKRQSRLRQSVAMDDEEDSDEETAQGKRLLGGPGPSGMQSRESFSQSRLSLADDTPRGSFDYGHAGSSNAGGYAAVPLRQSMDQQPKGGNFKDPWGQ